MNTKKSIIILLMFVLMMTITACNGIVRGTGDLVTENRQVSNFDRISLEGLGQVLITQGRGESLLVETDDNVMEHIKAEVEGRTLRLGIKEGSYPINMISPTQLIFTVGVDDFTGLSISGSGDIQAERIAVDRLSASISGAGKVQITNLVADEVRAEISGSGEVDLVRGEAASQDISIRGSGNYLAGDLCGAMVRVSASGSGETTVCAKDTLEADISGSGNVNYYGQPAIYLSGSGSRQINNLGK